MVNMVKILKINKKRKEELSNVLRDGLVAGSKETVKNKDKVFRKRIYTGKTLRRYKRNLGISLNKKDKAFSKVGEEENNA